MKNFLMIFLISLIYFLSCPFVVSAAENDAVDGLEAICSYEYYIRESDGTLRKHRVTMYNGYKVGEDIYMNSSVEFYFVGSDNSDYGLYPNLTNPQCHTLFCKSSSDSVYITAEYYEEYYNSNNELETRYSYGKLPQSSPFVKASELASVMKLTTRDMEYLNQFLDDGETFEDYVSFFENDVNYYATYNMGLNSSMENLSMDVNSNMIVKAGLIPDSVSGNDVGCIYSNRDVGLSNVLPNLILPFFYCSNGEVEPPYIIPPEDKYPADSAIDFKCWLSETKQLTTPPNASNLKGYEYSFCWDSSDSIYEELKSKHLCVEARGCVSGLDGYYYYSTPFELNILPEQSNSHMDYVEFWKTNEINVAPDVHDWYIREYFGTTSGEYRDFHKSFLNSSYRIQLRLTTIGGEIHSNWVTFDFDVNGKDIWDGVLDDSGNIVKDNSDDSEPDNNVTLPDSEPSDNVSGNNPPGTSNVPNDSNDLIVDSEYNGGFISWIYDVYNSITGFPLLLQKVYAWLPSDIVKLIAVSLGFIVIARILGR